MTTHDWIMVAAALAGGVIVGLVLSRVLNTILGAPSRPEPLRASAKPLSSLGFWAGVVGGLLLALGVVSPAALDQLPRDLVSFLPKVLSAAILLIAANVLASFASAALGPALARASTTVQRQVSMVVRATILVLASLLAIRQLGIDTTVINLGVAAIFFGLAGSLTLLVGLGGRTVASEVASTRAVRRIVATGDHVVVGKNAGEVIALHPTALEIRAADGSVSLIPSSQFLTETVTIKRQSAMNAKPES